MVQEALDKANLTERDLSAVAVTIGPGLSLCLRGNLWLKFFVCHCPLFYSLSVSVFYDCFSRMVEAQVYYDGDDFILFIFSLTDIACKAVDTFSMQF